MRIALWGAFDVEDCDRLAMPRVLEAELKHRLPGAVVTVFAPLGRLRPRALDGGRPAEPLAGLDGEALAGLGARFDCILVCTGDPLAAPGQAAAVWGHADAAALLDHPPDRGTAGCPVIPLDLRGGPEPPPPLALLLPRLLDAALRERRAAFLRLVGWAWEEGPVLTVQGGSAQLAAVGTLAAALLPAIESGEVAVQLAPAGTLDGEDAFAGALERALGGRCRRPSGRCTTLEDQAALVGASAGFLGPPGVGLWLAAALGVPAVTPSGGGGDALLNELRVARVAASGLATAIRGLLDPGAPRPDAGRAIARLDRHLDALAGAILAAAPDPAALARPDGAALCRAHDALGRRLLAERRALVRDLETRLRGARAEADRLQAELAGARAANDAIVGSRTWRYTRPVRDGVARLRERRR